MNRDTNFGRYIGYHTNNQGIKIQFNDDRRHAHYEIMFLSSREAEYSARRAVVVGTVDNIDRTRINLTKGKLEQQLDRMQQGKTTELEFRHFLEQC